MFELWKADEGVNSECTVDPFYNIDREGYFKGVIGNEMISSILALRYSPNFAFIGYYFVKEDYRHNKYGITLFNRALKHCGERTIELISVIEQQKNYEKSGFKTSGFMVDYTGISAHSEAKLNAIKYDEHLHLDDIATYDQDCFPADRKGFLKNWFNKKDTSTFVYYDSNNKLRGYGSIYKNDTQYVISPCYCDNKEIAKAIIALLVNSIPKNEQLIIFGPKSHQASVDFISETNDIYHWEKGHECPIMYKNGHPNQDWQKCFSIISEGIG